MPSLVDSGAYLDQLYQEKFGRAPDAAGKAYWKAELDSGKTSAEKIAQIFDNTDEAKQVQESRAQETKDFLEKTYAEELGREPDTSGAEYWANEISSGRQTQADVLSNIRASEEYQENQQPEEEEEAWQQEYDNQFNSAVNSAAGDIPAAETQDSVPDDSEEPVIGLPYIDPDSEQGQRLAINDIYQDILGRDTDQGGADYWYDELESGRQTLDDIRANVGRSEEASNVESNKAFIEEQYQEGLDRGSDAGGMSHWLKDLATGQSREDVAANIRRSDEYSTQADDYLDGLYENILDRDPDDEGLEYWRNELVSGNQTREEVEANINRSDEKWLGDTYKELLGRPLGDEGREYWLNDIEQGQTRDQVIANIKRSSEYLNRLNPTCPTGQHLENGVCVNDAPTECPDGYRIENGQCVPDIKICTMQACPPGQIKNENCECVDTDVPECPEGQMIPPGGSECAPIPDTECPTGSTRDSTGACIPDEHGDPEQCPVGQRRNAAGNCETDPNTLPDTECPDGYSRNEYGACVEKAGTWTGDDPTQGGNIGTYMGDDPTQGGNIGTYMGDDPTETLKKEEDETRNPLTTTKALNTTGSLEGGMPSDRGGDLGYKRTSDEYRDLYNAALKERESRNDSGGEERVSYGELQSRYGRLKADYDSARREADSYRDAQREDETSRLRSGITVGGAPGSRRTDIRSGNTALSDRSRRRGVSARSNRERDRSPSMQGIRSGF